MARKGNHPGEMPFLEHLEELRWRAFRSIVAVIVGTIAGWFIVRRFGVMELLLRPARDTLPGGKLIALGPATAFFVTMKLAVAVGLLLALPIVIREVWGFLSPGLKPSEKRIIVPSLYFGLVLFAGGAAMAYFWVLPLAFQFLGGFQAEYIEQSLEVNQYLAFVVLMLVAFGVAFELPIVVMILSALGLVTPAFLREKRRHAVVLITIVSSVLTPGDLISTFLMIGPLLVLYELSIFLSIAIYRRRAAEEKAAEERTILSPSTDPPSGSVGAEGP
jgi:sec-independent protein translocase protein TatC